MPLESAANPLISVIIPTYNAARFLPDAIASIHAQNYEPLEIIVVDDGSTDDTASVVAAWPEIRYLRQENQGPSGARNAGIRAARGELLAFLDVDDLWTTDHLQRLVPPLLAEPALRFVWGPARYVRLEEDAAGIRTHVTSRDNVPVFLVGSGVYRPSVFVEVGPFDPELRMGEDTDWLAAARLAKSPQRQISEVVLIYRQRKGSLTSGNQTIQAMNTFAILQRSIRRHRQKQQTEVADPRGNPI